MEYVLALTLPALPRRTMRSSALHHGRRAVLTTLPQQYYKQLLKWWGRAGKVLIPLHQSDRGWKMPVIQLLKCRSHRSLILPLDREDNEEFRFEACIRLVYI